MERLKPSAAAGRDDDGSALLRTFAEANPGAYQLAMQRGFVDVAHPLFGKLLKWWWLTAATVTLGRVFRAVSRHGTTWESGISENVVWYVVRNCARRLEIEHLAPHNLRRTCAKICHLNRGEVKQIQFLLGHASVLTTERYLGCKQNLEEPVNDRFGRTFFGGVNSR